MGALERKSLRQTDTITSLRYREVLEDFALLVQQPSALPASASVYAGGVAVTDSGSLGATTMWQHVVGANGFGSQNVNPGVTRQAAQNWSVDPVVDPEKLEAIRNCFKWVLFGHESVGPEGLNLLARPDQVPGTPGRHFGVLEQLERLPQGWLHTGGLRDVPVHACYKAHVGNSWAWVTAEGIGGLADFSLIIQDIARVGINSSILFNPGLNPYYLQLNAPNQTSYLDVSVADASPGVRVTRIGVGAIVSVGLQVGDVIHAVNSIPVTDVVSFRNAMPPYDPKATNHTVQLDVVRNSKLSSIPGIPVQQATPANVAIAVNEFGRLAPDTPYYRIRIDSQGSDPFLRSQISTIGSH